MTVESIKIDIDNIDPAQEVFGSIRIASTDRPISYVPYQLSKFSLGIVAKAGLDVFEDLILETPRGPATLKILGVETEGVPDGGARYNLMAADLKDDLEKVYSDDERVKQNLRGLQLARFQTSPPVILNIKTFGSTNPYVFKSINASKSGLLILSLNKNAVPFHHDTLLEIIIEPNNGWLQRSIKSVAKVVHQTTHESKGGLRLQYFGLELKDFSSDSEYIWRRAVEVLEKETIERGLRAMGRISA
jgi:hypothetical protein